MVKHVESQRCHLTVTRNGDEALVRVFDRSPHLPVIDEPAWDAESGRGLWMLREMAPRFGYEVGRSRKGKCIWFACGLKGYE
ncbi:hypothetical protein GCM10022245_02570 [Streptomyces mayteni]